MYAFNTENISCVRLMSCGMFSHVEVIKTEKKVKDKKKDEKKKEEKSKNEEKSDTKDEKKAPGSPKAKKDKVVLLWMNQLKYVFTDRDHTFITSARKGGAGGVLKFIKYLQILLFLNNRSNAHFCEWRGGGQKISHFCACHKCMPP